MTKIKAQFLITTLVVFLFPLAAYAQEAPTEGPRPVATASSKKDAAEGPSPVATADPAPVAAEGMGAGAHHLFPKGQCTQCAADAYKDRTGQNVTWSGDAKDWLKNAAAAGFKTSPGQSTLIPKAILVFGPIKGDPWGHVAIADSVSSTSVTVTECNWPYGTPKRQRTIKLSDLRQRYNLLGVILP